MSVQDFFGIEDLIVVEAIEDIFLGLSTWSFLLLLVLLFPLSLLFFLEHVDNITFQYFIAECTCLFNSLPS